MPSNSIVPISGMNGYRDGPGHVQIGKVRFATCYHISEQWHELGFHADPIAHVRSEPFNMELDDTDVLAIVPSLGSAKDAAISAPEEVLDPLRFLLACNPAWGRRKGAKLRPLLPGLNVSKLHGFVFTEELRNRWPHWVAGTSARPLHEVRLDGFWYANSRAGYYWELQDLLCERTTVTTDWGIRLTEAALLLGHSRMTAAPWQAFLTAMIGVERLLKSYGTSWTKQVGGGIRSLFSWLKGKGQWYADEMLALYRLRNAVVHEGQVTQVSPRSAHVVDEVLFNLLLVSFKHLDCVRSLEELLERARAAECQVARGEKPTALPNAQAIHSPDY
jgi:hypothetical protein